MPHPIHILARARADAAIAAPLDPRPPRATPPARWLAVGDPQTSFDHFVAVLVAHGLIADDGLLRPDVGLISMGDHFDYAAADPHDSEAHAAAGREGLSILGWLGAHPPEQVIILLGNHDAARVMELHAIEDAQFDAARQLALRALLEPEQTRPALEQEFFARFSAIPTPEIARRDWSSFHSAQRQLVESMLTAGRLCLAAVGKHAGREILLTHNGVTTRELSLLELADRADPATIATALNRFLAARLARVRPAWQQGSRAALDLEPLVVAGTSGKETGGFLVSRPADRDGSDLDGDAERAELSWKFNRQRPRRFEPRALPPGLVQACGHTRPDASIRDLARWTTPAVRAGEPGRLRTLAVSRESTRYDLGVLPAGRDAAILYLLDANLHEVAADRVELLELGGARVPD
jgi:hypothetical protein